MRTPVRERAQRHRARPVVLALGLGLVALAGCTAQDDGPEAAPGWTEPGWMAQVRQQDEEYQNAMIACYAEHGLKATKAMGGSVGLVDLPQDAATQQLADEAATDNARIPLPDHALNKTLDDAAYQRMLDMRDCIIAHGYEVSDPPSAQTWKDTTPVYEAWSPYAELVNGAQALDSSALFALERACQQPGPNYQVLAPTGG